MALGTERLLQIQNRANYLSIRLVNKLERWDISKKRRRKYIGITPELVGELSMILDYFSRLKPAPCRWDAKLATCEIIKMHERPKPGATNRATR